MGYLTDYDGYIVRFDTQEISEEEADKLIENIVNMSSTDWEWDHDGRVLSFFGSAKWYDCEGDLKDYTSKHPEYTFVVYGSGEEPGDIWVLYVSKGAADVCMGEVVYEPRSIRLSEDGSIENEMENYNHPIGSGQYEQLNQRRQGTT